MPRALTFSKGSQQSNMDSSNHLQGPNLTEEFNHLNYNYKIAKHTFHLSACNNKQKHISNSSLLGVPCRLV